jgi:flagellar hook-length control protein FliK
LLQIKATANGEKLQLLELQDFKASFIEEQVSSLKNSNHEISGLSKNDIVNNTAVEQLKQFKDAVPSSNTDACDKDLKMQIKASIGAENNAAVMKVGDVGSDMDTGEKSFSSGNKGNNKEIPAGVTHVQQAASNKGETVVKETFHVGRLNEISEPIMKTLSAGDKHLIIKLEPPDLGSIHIKLRIDNSGMLRADFRVNSNVVRDLFSAAMPQIKASLEDSGIKVSNFFVDIKEDYYSDSSKRQEQEDANQHQQKQNKQEKYQFFDYFA